MKREVAFVHSLPLNVIIDVVGWIYFFAWSISSYPQVYVCGLLVIACIMDCDDTAHFMTSPTYRFPVTACEIEK